jgi:hypothetical protein
MGDKFIITITRITRGVSHYGLAICIKKISLKAKEELLETQIFISPCKNINLKTIL